MKPNKRVRKMKLVGFFYFTGAAMLLWASFLKQGLPEAILVGGGSLIVAAIFVGLFVD